MTAHATAASAAAPGEDGGAALAAGAEKPVAEAGKAIESYPDIARA